MMSTSSNYTKTISFKLLLSITGIIVVICSTIGFLSYDFAKKELVNSGKLDLQHIVKAAIPTLDHLNKQVESGQLSLNQAKEMARTEILGPAAVQGRNQNLRFFPFTFSLQNTRLCFCI